MRETARLAGLFAEPFGAGELAHAAGLVHDAGKATERWQEGLIRAAASGGPVGLDHKMLGAWLLLRRGKVAAATVMGHHGGLQSAAALAGVGPEGDPWVEIERFFGVVPEARALVEGPSLMPVGWGDRAVAEFGVRMVFSALVDADHLDTAAHFAGASVRLAPASDMEALAARFERERLAVVAGRSPSPVDAIREAVFEEVMRHAPGERGVFRMPGPTGSGKTLTLGAFALRHAACHRMSRVVVAVPFTTVTEQTAAVYRRLLGRDVVLEHHSNTEVEHHRPHCVFGGRDASLGAENWDAPFVVTTTVQLFDSLFGRMPARSRKLHRLANAVIVLDEVHALPADLLEHILDGLRLLTEHFGASVVLASATQPAFEHFPAGRRAGIRSLVADAGVLYRSLKRVRYEWRVQPQPTLPEMVAEAAAEPRALVVVNTVDHARVFFRDLQRAAPHAAVFHLSTRMVPAHRRWVLAEVQRLLAEGAAVTVVSTQLVECGVDMDFPVVFRALAPAESLQQAAGRANREGALPEHGRVVVFDIADLPVPRFYRAAVDKTRTFFADPRIDPDDPVVLDAYFRALYQSQNVQDGGRASAITAARHDLDFAAVADGPLVQQGSSVRDRRLAFRMIDDDGVPVVVSDYGDTDRVLDLVEQVRAGQGPLREVFRELRGHMVRLPRHVMDRPDVGALCRPLVAGSRAMWEWVGAYDRQVGIDIDAIDKETIF
ncbi:CRISPR-associated helicase Cas3' [Actinokineospora guangxiensis]|uniref:CRISPR-associated helicase Cas3 n=1 Tax=Actinokineospora guangxiensis TaxID=1490288 RepID=A0ABW0EPT7_9PSEU